ncbi:MAG: hypothetical protein MR239_06355 [Clostridiales bacterium]|nr:hypothetical protein [Clostridiales bacterium]MDY4655152.1 hypothetical protein [Eubacteriales bacterium]
MAQKTKWYRLDNSGMIYPMVITLRTQSLYRLGALLKTDVKKDSLIYAVEKALDRYPYFKVELKPGLFRHYLEENARTPLVEEDDGVLLKILNFRHNRYYLFRVTYYGKRIFIDFFHGLCDGNGGMEFLKTVLYYYFEKEGISVPCDNVITLETPESEGETEDSFKKYYKKIKLLSGTKKMAGGNAFHATGKQFSYEGFGLIQAEVSTEKLLAAARKHGCSITVFLAALALLSFAVSYGTTKQKEDFVAFIPVNLRKKFPSNTMFNFTNFAKCSVPRNAYPQLDAFIGYVKNSLQEQLTEEELQVKLSFSSLMDKLFFLKFMPLAIKGFISRIGRELSLKSKQTMIISNLGEIKFDGGKNVEHFLFNLNCSERTPINMGVVSYDGKTIISFTRKLVATKIEQAFCSKLAEECGEVKVSSNFREECDVL